MRSKNETSLVVIVAGLIAFGLLAFGAVLLVATGPEGNQRLGIFLASIAPAILALVAVLKADQAATNTNGSLDQRIEDGVHRALAGRRSTDVPVHPELPPSDPTPQGG